MKTHPLLAVAIVVGLGTVALTVLASSSESAPPSAPTMSPAPSMPPMLTTDELKFWGISQATDVTADPSAVTPAPRVLGAEAVSIAAKYLGRPTSNTRVLHGSARPIRGQQERSVWIILFTGGDVPVAGPPHPSMPPVPLRYVGVEIDDQTGAVQTGFMH